MSYIETQPLLPKEVYVPSEVYVGKSVEVIVDPNPTITPIVVDDGNNKPRDNVIEIHSDDFSSFPNSRCLRVAPILLSNIDCTIEFPPTSILRDIAKSHILERQNISQKMLDSLQIQTVLI